MLGTVLRQLGKQDEALAEFKTTIQIEPQSPEAYLSIGQILQRQQDTAGATAAFAEADRLNAIKSNQQASIFALSVGRKRMSEHNLDGALSQFREAVRLDPSSAPAQHALADALTQKGETAEAREHLEAARRLEAPAAPREP
jgi:cytochrome c-type biogenesis protein CcmH/NrfG